MDLLFFGIESVSGHAALGKGLYIDLDRVSLQQEQCVFLHKNISLIEISLPRPCFLRDC